MHSDPHDGELRVDPEVGGEDGGVDHVKALRPVDSEIRPDHPISGPHTHASRSEEMRHGERVTRWVVRACLQQPGLVGAGQSFQW